MAVPAISRISFSWTGALTGLSFLAAAWAAIQVGFLASALTQGPPSPGSRLVFEHHNQVFFYILIFHAAAIIAFGLGGMLAGKACRQVDRMAVGARRTWTQTVYGAAYVIPLVALLMVFQISNDAPRYQIYVEDSMDEIIRMETRLMPAGVSEQLVAFSDVRVIEGEMDYSSWWGDRYFINVVTIEWETMQIGQGGRGEDPALLFPLAQDVADSAGAKLDLSSKIPIFR